MSEENGSTQHQEIPKEVRDQMDLMNQAQQAGVLLGLLAEKLEIEWSAHFWNDLYKEYNRIQKESADARKEFVKTVGIDEAKEVLS